MQKVIIVFTLLLSTNLVEGWLFDGKLKDTRNCFCEVVDADTNSQIHNFGSIQSCSGFPTCACRRQEMITCGDKCDERVAEWLESNRAKCAGRFIKKYYKASTCGSPTYGHERRKC